jgi:hypothetical protein
MSGDVDQAAGRCQEILQCHLEPDHAGRHQAVAVADAPGQRVHEWRAKSAPIFAPISVSLMLDPKDARTFTDADAASLGLLVIEAARRKLAETDPLPAGVEAFNAWLDDRMTEAVNRPAEDRSLLEIEADAALYFATPTSPTIDYVDTQWRLVHDVPGLIHKIRALTKLVRAKTAGQVHITRDHPGVGKTILGYRVTDDIGTRYFDPADVVIIVADPPTPSVYVTPGHPVKAGAGYDCNCGECLARRREIVDGHTTLCECTDCTDYRRRRDEARGGT